MDPDIIAQTIPENLPLVGLHRFFVHIPAASMKTLKLNPFQICKAPPQSNLHYIPMYYMLSYNPGSAPFGNLAAPAWRVSFGPANASSIAFPAGTLAADLALGALNPRHSMSPMTSLADVTANLENAALYLFNSGASDVTLGDGSVDLTLWVAISS